MLPCVAAGASLVLAETCQPGNSTPRFLAAQRSAVSSRREEIAILRWRVNTQGSADPCAIPMVLIKQRLPCRALLRFLPALSFWIAAAIRYAMRSTIRLPGSELTVFRRRKAFLLCKNPCGGTAVGMGSPPQSGIAAPAQRNFQRKFALRQVGSYKFVVPLTSSRSKVRNNARLVTCPCRAAPGCQRDRGPSVSGRVQRNPFQGVPLGNFFAEARHRASLRS